jgi:hypothetical protein
MKVYFNFILLFVGESKNVVKRIRITFAVKRIIE